MVMCKKCEDQGTWSWSDSFCDCPTGRRLEAETVSENRRAAVDMLRLHAQIPSRIQKLLVDPAGDMTAVRSQAVEWYESGAWQIGQNLMIVGPTGTGKSVAACAILYRHTQQLFQCLYWPVPGLMDALRPMDTPRERPPEQIMAQVQQTPLLVLDDIGIEKPTEWVRERLYLIVNARYDAELATILTSNRTLRQLQDTFGDRIATRIGENLHTINATGGNLRGARARGRGTSRSGYGGGLQHGQGDDLSGDREREGDRPVPGDSRPAGTGKPVLDTVAADD